MGARFVFTAISLGTDAPLPANETTVYIDHLKVSDPGGLPIVDTLLYHPHSPGRGYSELSVGI